jgi:hypothetical protein
MVMKEQQGVAAELLLTVCAEASRAAASAALLPAQQGPAVGVAPPVALGQLNNTVQHQNGTVQQQQQQQRNGTVQQQSVRGDPSGHTGDTGSGCSTKPPECLPPQLSALTSELEGLTRHTMAATISRLKDCVDHTLSPYRLFTSPPGVTSTGAVQAAFATHNEGEQQSAQAGIKHAGTAMRLLGLTNLLLMHYGTQPPARTPLVELASSLLSLLAALTKAVSECVLPAEPRSNDTHSTQAATIHQAHQQPLKRSTAGASSKTVAGGTGAPSWQVQQYTAAKQRHRLMKLLLNDVLNCLELLMGSDAGWRAVVELPTDTLAELKYARQQRSLELTKNVNRLGALIMLLQRPTFKASTGVC